MPGACQPGCLALASVNKFMATNLASVEAREVLRCDHCSLVQFRTMNSLCRRCHKPLEMEEPEPLVPQLVTESSPSPTGGSDLDVARAVRDIRRSRRLSQRQLAGRMQVPRTYISKIENGKAVPTLSSLGIPKESIPEIASKAAKASSMKANPIELTPHELEAILEAAW